METKTLMEKKVILCVLLLILLPAALVVAEGAGGGGGGGGGSGDITPPVTTDNAPKGWRANDFNVTLTASDDNSGVASTSFRIDGSEWLNGTPLEINSDGNHAIEYYSIDNAGNVEETKTTYAALDKTKPQFEDSYSYVLPPVIPPQEEIVIPFGDTAATSWGDKIKFEMLNSSTDGNLQIEIDSIRLCINEIIYYDGTRFCEILNIKLDGNSVTTPHSGLTIKVEKIAYDLNGLEISNVTANIAASKRIEIVEAVNDLTNVKINALIRNSDGVIVKNLKMFAGYIDFNGFIVELEDYNALWGASEFKAFFDTNEFVDGTYFIDFNAVDKAGNLTEKNNAASFIVSYGVRTAYYKQDILVTAAGSTIIDASGDANVIIGLESADGIEKGSIYIIKELIGRWELPSTITFEIGANDEIKRKITKARIKFFYDETDIASKGITDESKIYIYKVSATKYNLMPPQVYSIDGNSFGVDTTANYAWVDVNEFSFFMVTNDANAPVITTVESNSPYEDTNVTITLTLNEPVYCRFSETDQNYESMQTYFTPSNNGLTHSKNLTAPIGSSIYYAICKDFAENYTGTAFPIVVNVRFCGDGIRDPEESCSSCPSDAGACAPINNGGDNTESSGVVSVGGGGGGGGSGLTPEAALTQIKSLKEGINSKLELMNYFGLEDSFKTKTAKEKFNEMNFDANDVTTIYQNLSQSKNIYGWLPSFSPILDLNALQTSEIPEVEKAVMALAPAKAEIKALSVKSTVTKYKIYYSDTKKTLFGYKIERELPTGAGTSGYYIEEIPKELVGDANQLLIKTTAGFKVIESDPVIAWDVSVSGSKIEYAIVSENEKDVNSIKASFIAFEQLKEIEAPTVQPEEEIAAQPLETPAAPPANTTPSPTGLAGLVGLTPVNIALIVLSLFVIISFTVFIRKKFKEKANGKKGK
ncbi:MAG: hypothetical protein V1494_05915 [Candidatus Diapherotrites archaeon]